MTSPSRPGRASRAAIQTASVACGALAAFSLYAILEDRPDDGEATAMLYGLPILALVLALSGFTLNARARYAVPALLASVVCVALFWTLAALYAG